MFQVKSHIQECAKPFNKLSKTTSQTKQKQFQQMKSLEKQYKNLKPQML